MGDNTTLSCSPETLERFNALREQAKDDHTPAPTQDMMLNSLMDTWDAADAGHYDEEPDTVDVENIAEQLAGQAVTFDDVQQACRAALREELPDRVLQA